MASTQRITVHRSSRPQSLNSTPSTLISIDLLLHVLSQTLFHPFLAALLPLCLRAFAAQYNSPSFIFTTAFAACVNLSQVFQWINQRLAYGWPREMRWADEVVVITGGKGGLGGVLAEIFSMRGVPVAILDLSVTAEEEMADREGGARLYRCDVGNAKEVEMVWEKVVSDQGAPTILINNAAISYPASVYSQSSEKVSQVFQTNVLSHFHLSKLFLRSRLVNPIRFRQGGHIVTIGSVLAHLGAANLSAYSASKGALHAYHASLSAELSTCLPQFKTVLVAPGQLDTALFREVKIRGWLQRFAGPMTGAQELAMGIIKLLDQGMGGEVRMPFFARMIAWLAILPDSLRVFLRKWSRVDEVVLGDDTFIEALKPLRAVPASELATPYAKEDGNSSESEEESSDDKQ